MTKKHFELIAQTLNKAHKHDHNKNVVEAIAFDLSVKFQSKLRPNPICRSCYKRLTFNFRDMGSPVEVGGSPRRAFLFWHGTCRPPRAIWLYHWAGGR